MKFIEALDAYLEAKAESERMLRYFESTDGGYGNARSDWMGSDEFLAFEKAKARLAELFDTLTPLANGP